MGLLDFIFNRPQTLKGEAARPPVVPLSADLLYPTGRQPPSAEAIAAAFAELNVHVSIEGGAVFATWTGPKMLHAKREVSPHRIRIDLTPHAVDFERLRSASELNALWPCADLAELTDGLSFRIALQEESEHRENIFRLELFLVTLYAVSEASRAEAVHFPFSGRVLKPVDVFAAALAENQTPFDTLGLFLNYIKLVTPTGAVGVETRGLAAFVPYELRARVDGGETDIPSTIAVLDKACQRLALLSADQPQPRETRQFRWENSPSVAGVDVPTFLAVRKS